MKKLLIIANWKSNKTTQEAIEWLEIVSSVQSKFSEEKKVILCPPFTLLPLVKDFIEKRKLPIVLCAQNISPFDKGQYTGEINGEQVKEFTSYTLIGHSERRMYFAENDTMIANKIGLAERYQITPIYCVQNKETTMPKNVHIIAYEPPAAIGTGHPDTPASANTIAEYFKKNSAITQILYGGSVSAKNVQQFTTMLHIDGVLVGTASLDAQEFKNIILNA